MSTTHTAPTQYSTITDLIQNKGGSYMHILVVALCMMTNMLDGFDITAMAVVANAVGDEMNLSTDKLGFAFSFSLAGMMLGAMFLASLSDIFGRRNITLISLAVVGMSVLCTAFVSNLPELIILRFISGLGAGAMLASQTTLTSEYSPDKYRALCIAIVTAGYPLGAMMTGLVAQHLIVDYGWRSMFILGGSLSLLMCVVVYILLPESLQFLCVKKPPNALKKVNKILSKYNIPALTSLPEHTQLQAEINIQKTQTKTNLFTRFYYLMEKEYRVKTITLWFSFMLTMSTLYFLMSWVPKLIVMEGFSQTVANYAFSIFNFGGVAGIFLMGIIAVRWKLSTVISVLLILAGILMLVFAAIEKSEIIILTLIGILGVILQGGFAGLYALAAKIYPTEIRSTGVGWALGIGRFGAVIGPAVAGYTIAANVTIESNFVLFAIPVLIGGIAIYRLAIK